MWYINGESVGIKRHLPKSKQIFSFGGKRSTYNRENLMQFGLECVQKLEGGMAEKDVKEWVFSMTKPAD